MGVQSSRTSHSSELWGLCHRKDWNWAWSLLLSLPTLTDSEQLPAFLGQGYFGTSVRLGHKHYNTVAAQQSKEPQYWSENIPWSAVQSAVCQCKVLGTKTNDQLLPREPWSGSWIKFKIHLQSILRLNCCDWNWLVCLVCESSEDFRSLVQLMYSHTNKTHEEGSKDALPVTLFFQSRISDLQGFSPGARSRPRATGTWPSQTWRPPGLVAWPSAPSSTDSSLSWCGYQSRPAALLQLLSPHTHKVF